MSVFCQRLFTHSFVILHMCIMFKHKHRVDLLLSNTLNHNACTSFMLFIYIYKTFLSPGMVTWWLVLVINYSKFGNPNWCWLTASIYASLTCLWWTHSFPYILRSFVIIPNITFACFARKVSFAEVLSSALVKLANTACLSQKIKHIYFHSPKSHLFLHIKCTCTNMGAASRIWQIWLTINKELSWFT